MDCPYCKKEMQKGNIMSGTHIRWYPEEVETTVFAEWESTVRLHTGGWLDSAKAEAYYCCDCRIVIAPVPEIESSMDKLKKKWGAFTQRVSEENEKRREERQEERREKEKENKRKKDPWEV